MIIVSFCIAIVVKNIISEYFVVDRVAHADSGICCESPIIKHMASQVFENTCGILCMARERKSASVV